MNSNNSFEQIEKAFFTDGYRIAMQAVETGLSPKTLQSSL